MLAAPRRYKGLVEFLRLADAYETRTEFRFTLILNCEQVEVNRLRNFYAIPGNVDLHAKSADPSLYYRTADLLLNLSRVDQWVETFGLTLVEGMSFGVPIIAPPVGGPAEILAHGIEGYLIDSRNHAKLVSHIDNMAANPDLAMSLSRAARRKAQSYDFKRFSKGVSNCVEEVMSGGTFYEDCDSRNCGRSRALWRF